MRYVQFLMLTLLIQPVLAADKNSNAVGDASRPLAQISESFFTEEFKYSPTFATETGIHDYDALLDEVTPAAHQAHVTRLRHTLEQVAALPAISLSPIERDDREIFAGWLNAQLLEEERVQLWRHDPNKYIVLGLNSVNWLMIRSFAPPDERLRCVIARLKRLPRLLTQAQANLRNMPAVYIEMALENIAGVESFLTESVPGAFTDVSDATLRAELNAATVPAVKAFLKYENFLAKQKHSANGSFALGRETYSAFLSASLIDATPDQVLSAGEAQLARDRIAYDATAQLINPLHPDQALADISGDHPKAEMLISTARNQLQDLREFILNHSIARIPTDRMPEVQPTPSFRRAAIFGELDWPGPLETLATTSFYYITTAQPGATSEEQERFLRLWNYSTLQDLSVHEGLPGHYLQGLYRQAHSGWSKIRQVTHAMMAEEGWAHYAEQMMLDEGLSNGDPRARLAQLNMSLLRDCRLIGSVKMHVQGQSLADAATAMRERCAISEVQAYREARRGTEDPGYFCYTLGKLEIIKLRDDVMLKEGEKFSLKNFHDRFLAAGLIPIKIIRRELLSD